MSEDAKENQEGTLSQEMTGQLQRYLEEKTKGGQFLTLFIKKCYTRQKQVGSG